MSALLDALTLPARLLSSHTGRKAHRRCRTSQAVASMAAPDHIDRMERSA